MLNKLLKTSIILTIISALYLPFGYTQPLFLTPEYLGFIQEKISSSFIYPQEALLKGWEGIVKVKFVVAENGRIKDIDIAESSGYPLLDAVAILAIKDASPYPFPEGYPGGKDLEIVLPIDYQQPKSASSVTFLSAPSVTESSNSFVPKLLQEEVSTEPIMQEQVVAPEPLSVEQLLSPLSLSPIIEGAGEHILSTQNKELADFVQTALTNNQPTKIAREEVELAQLKVTEAKRNFFPSLKIQSYATEGEVYKIKYEEKENKIQLDQPLFYGGRLIDSLKQAQANLEINQKNFERLKLDVVQKTEAAYYNLVSSRILLKQQEKIYKEGMGLLGSIEKLTDIGMLIPLEATSARSWLEQIRFQMDSTKQDLYMAELTLKQVLNIQELPDIKTQLLEPKRLNLDFESCLETAMKRRPEIYLSELLVKFNEYGKKVEASKSKSLTLDFTSSYGSYEGAYKTEPMQSSDNWYIGIKASRPWGASTINTTVSSEETQPRFGQTSATASSTISTELNIFDNLKRISDKKKADIDFRRSISDFDETLKTINFEVQDAFLNYQKAILQFNTALSEMKFRRNELKVAKIRALTGEATISSALSSLVSFSEALTKYMQALGNYYISISNLRKATGYGFEI